MRFAVLGGDRRSAVRCRLLLQDGHRVSAYALEKAELPKEVPGALCIQSAVYGADAVLLPVPAERGGFLNTPLSSEQLSMKELTDSLWRGQLMIGGKLSEDSCLSAVKAGLQVEDIMQRADFAAGNAALTAEGAAELLMAESEKSIWRSDILVCGWGRIGKILSTRLKALGAEVCLCARNSGDRALAGCIGYKTIGFSQLESRSGEFDFIINTVPERVISRAALCCCESGSIIMELASAPGGFDRNLAENIGLRVIHAPGLPGKCAPCTGAELIKEAVYRTIAEQED